MVESIDVRHLEEPTNGPGMMTGFAGADGIVPEKWTHLEPRQPGLMQIEVDFQLFFSNHTLTLDEAGTLITWHEVAIVEEPHWRWLLKLSATSAIKNRQTVMGAIEKVLLQQ
jgi:hypothetical protein